MLSFRARLLLVVALVALVTTLWWAQRSTPAEALAFRQAAVGRPAYTLPPDKLKSAQELFRARTILHFGGEGMSLKILPIKLPAQPRPAGIVTLKNRTLGPVAQLFIDCARETSKQ